MVQVLSPHIDLSKYICAYMHRRIDFSKGEVDNFHYCTPTHKKYIMLYLSNSVKVTFNDGISENKKDMVVVGPLSKPVHIHFGQEHRLIAIELQNTGQFYLLDGCPIHTIVDCNIEADVIFGPKTNELIEKLSATLCAQEIKKLLDTFLLQRLKDKERVFDKTDALLNDIPQGKSITDLASLAGISTRQLERICKEKIGMSPSFYNKLRRFSSAYQLKERHPELKWTDIAYTTGYFDQTHLIKDFREFSGLSPGEVNKILLEQYKGYTDYGITND